MPHEVQQAKATAADKQESFADIARRTGIPYGTLYRWVKMEGMALEDAKKRRPMTPSEVGKYAGEIGAQKRWGKNNAS